MESQGFWAFSIDDLLKRGIGKLKYVGRAYSTDHYLVKTPGAWPPSASPSGVADGSRGSGEASGRFWRTAGDAEHFSRDPIVISQGIKRLGKKLNEEKGFATTMTRMEESLVRNRRRKYLFSYAVVLQTESEFSNSR